MDLSVLDLVADAVSPIWWEFGIDVPPAAGVYAATTPTICPASLDPAAVELAGAQAIRPVPVPLAEPQALPVSFAEPDRPLVYLTLGTFSNNDIDLFSSCSRRWTTSPSTCLRRSGETTIRRPWRPFQKRSCEAVHPAGLVAPAPRRGGSPRWRWDHVRRPRARASFGGSASRCRQLQYRQPARESWGRSHADARRGDWRGHTVRAAHRARCRHLRSADV
jgi:hypothetical protein